ncbi:uncharacterized protein LOC134340887 [Mobula hypostoma]|uniref:uncharacterized protein LOC134340887 n=1 Tax=Mobula hypostoma TaxID=723540 RepID=UPI002FC2D858
MSPGNATRHVTSASLKDPETQESGVHQLFVNGTLFSGIFNPTACFHTGSIVLFTVISEYYPVYDSVNLYNTDSDFDWGAFRDLVKKMEFASNSSWLFIYRFNQPGVHVFQLSSNPNKKMYVRVMPVGGQCYEEGPFFPTSPSSFIRMGIRRAQDLHFNPDWFIISSLLAAVMATVGICAGLMLLFRKSSWPKKVIVTPRYQHLQKAYNFDDYSSKEAAIIAVKKTHRSLQFAEQTGERDENGGRKEDSVSKNREFGNYDEQIDLELFNTNTFYQILLKQSLAVSVRLSQHKKEVKMLYQKITEVTESLREHWMERTNFVGKHVIKKADLEVYKKMCYKVRLEIKRRKDIGLELEEILDKQQQLFQADWNHREEHHITFSVALREAVRLLEEPLNHEENSAMETSPVNQRDSEQVEALLLQMSDAIAKECERLSVWSVLGKGMGAQLVEKETLKVLSKEELIGADIDHGLLQVDQLTGLLTPSPDVVMLLDNKYTMPVPDSFFLHPQTGRVLPMAGNVCYDTMRSCLLPVTDLATGVVYQSEENLIPYVPYPLCPEASLPQKLHQSDVKLGEPMPDPETGIRVPVIAMTIHLQTGLVHPLGGTYISPITRMLAPIELGAPMVCKKTGQMVPIIGVGLNTTTGAVIPLGGVLKSSNKPMFLGYSFTEPLSGRSARISGAYVQDTEVMPHAGGYQALLDGAVLVNEAQILETLKDCKDSVTAQGSGVSSLNQKQRGTLREALGDLVRARRRSWAHIIHTMHNLERQRKEAKDLANRGGNVGMIPFAATDLLFPAVVGMYIPDPGGSGLEVPILGVEYDSDTGRLIPLAGTMEDSDGRGLIPIALGARGIDPITGETGPVVGARLDARTKIVLPVIQGSRGIMRRKLDGEMVKTLDEELHCRREHWHHQQQKEEALFIALKDLLQEVTDTKTDCRFTKVEDKVRAVGEKIILLQDCAQSEAQRRHMEESNLASLMPTDVIVLLSKVDKEEAEQQMLFLAAVQTILEKVTQFAKKMSQDESRQRGQLRQPWEAAFQQAEEASPIGHPQLKTLLTQEFQENIISQWTDLDMVYIRLEHLRELAEQCALEAKVVLSGDVYCFGDCQLTGSQNAGVFHGPSDSTNRKMLPLIKQLINLLDTDRNIILSPDTLNLISNKGHTASSRPQGGWLPYPEPPGIPERSLTMAPDTSISGSSPPSNNIYAERQALIRFHIEKQASEAAHLEIALISDEVKQIWKLLEEEQQKGEDSERLDQMEKLLRDLLEQHRKSVLALYAQHTVELMEVGLDPNLAMPQNILGMEKDIMSGLQLLVTDFQKFYARSKHKQDVPLQSETNERNVEAPVAQCLDTEGSLTYHSLETLQSWELSLEALKLVTLEVRKLSRVYKTIDMYSKLQVQSSDQALSQLLNKQDWPLGEQTALRVGRYLEEEHIRRLSDLLRLQREERKRWVKADGKPHEGNEGLCLTEKLVGEDSIPHSSKHSADLQKELALQIEERENLVEEQLQLQEEQTIMEAEAGNGIGDIGTVVYDIQLLRHLRQYVLLEQRLKQQRQECREASHNCIKQLLTEDNDGDMKCLYNQAKGHNQAFMGLKSAAALLELREKNLQELADRLKSFTSDKIKELEASLAEEEKLEGEMVAQDLLKKKRQQNLWMTQIETKLQDQLERGELTREHRENLNKEHSIRLWLQEKSLQQEIEQIEKDQEVKWKREKDDSQLRIAERKAEEEQKAEASHSQQVRQLLNKEALEAKLGSTNVPLACC